MDDLLRIGSSGLEAAVSPLGAELRSLRTANGDELMWSGDARWWGGVAPLLFPVIGRTPEAGIRIDGRRFAMPMHGFAQRSRFETVAHAGDRLQLRLRDDAESRSIFPFAFDLSVDVAAEADALSIVATVRNTGASPMPMSLGFHPGFRLPGGKDAYRLRFAAAEAATVRRAGGGFLLPDPVPSPVQDRELALAALEFATGAYIFPDLASRAVTLSEGDRPLLEIGFEGCSSLALWSRPGAGFLCIEPWRGLPQTADFDGNLPDRPGMNMLAPGGDVRVSLRIGVHGR